MTTIGSDIAGELLPGIALKVGVDSRDLQPELVRALEKVRALTNGGGFGPLVVTSLRDGVHLPNSLHYKGLAADLRTRHLTPERRAQWAAAIRVALGDDFDVLDEGDHIHLEFDP